MRTLLLCIIAILTLFCIAQLVTNPYGLFMSTLTVALTFKFIHLSIDRDRYRDEFRRGKNIIQSYRDEYEPE